MTRALDILVASVALVVLSPFLLAAAIAIKLGGRGPVLYRQLRVGRDGREFEMLKLRTMVEGSDPVGVGTVVTRDDPRVTRAGRFLRRTSLDEVPNLLNVLRGEMAVVGPRPTIPAQVVDYTPFQRSNPRLERVDQRPAARQHLRLRVEFLARHQIELARAIAQHPTGMRLDIRAEGLHRSRQILRETPDQ